MGVIARQTIKGSVANYLGIAIGFVTTFFVLTDCLSPEEIGLTRILVDASLLFTSLAQLGTSSSIIRFYPYFKDSDSNDHGFFAYSILLPLIGFALFTVFFFLCKQNIIELYADKSPLFTEYVYILLPFTFFALYLGIFENNANVLMRIAVPKFVREVCIRVINLVLYILYGNHIISIDLFVILFCGSYGAATLLDFLYLLALGRVSFRIDLHFPSRKLIKDIATYTLMVTVMGITGNIQLLNSLFLGAQGGLAMAGIYTIANYIASVVGVPSRSLSAISNPMIAQAVKENNITEVNRLCKQVSLHQLLAGSLVYFFIIINLDVLFKIIPNGELYDAGISVVLILGFSNTIAQMLSPIFSVLSFSKSYGYSLPFSLMLSVISILLNLYLIPLFGINGAAIATFSATLIYYALGYVFTYWKLHLNVLSRKHLVVAALMCVLIALNFVWKMFVSPLFGDTSSTAGALVEAVCKTLVMGIITVWATYKLNISDNINDIILKFMRAIVRK
ncbi:MAG: polysaccharide biosynthesis protein [Bacteroidales bacterium]|nr:polysaccharide biosynthesis protein [Candidatus Colimorpha onthohippi]